MEDHAAGPEPGVSPDPSLHKRLEQLEREAAELRAKLSAPPPDSSHKSDETDKEPELPPPTAEQIEKAENLIRQARLARSRGQSAQATEFLNQAESLAPNAPIVLEFIGDDYAEHNNFRKARDTYKKALRYAPNNVAIDRKHADMVFKTSNFGNLQNLSEFEVVANAKRAVAFNFFIPGSGQIVTGEPIKGGFILGLWLLSLVSIKLIPNGVQTLIDLGTGRLRVSSFNAVVLIPLAIAIIIQIAAIFDASIKAKSYENRKVLHPEPPDKLPFE